MPSTASASAPRWAGYTAALFGLEYAVVKVIMAGRGELGVPGHAAPPEAYEHFSGNVTTAQLGNAAFGLVTVLIALALVQRWGRRLPAAALAAGAGVSLLCAIAGTFIVTASLTGLREDHGQWGVDSLVLGVAPLVAWLVLTVAAIRAARTQGMPPWVRAIARPGRRAALAAGTACVAYGALKLDWALGGEFLMRETPLPPEARHDLLAREPVAVAGHWISIGLATIGIALAVATVRGRRLPRPLTVGLPTLIGVVMLLRAGWGSLSDVVELARGDADYAAGWDLGLWSPFFAAWGTSWILAAHAAGGRSARPALDLRRRLAHVTAAWGILFAAVHVYWAAGGEVGMNGEPAETLGAQLYIGCIALIGLTGAGVARAAVDHPHPAFTRLARLGGAALLLGVAFGTGRWVSQGSLGDDGAAGVATTLYFLLGGILFTAVARAPGAAARAQS